MASTFDLEPNALTFITNFGALTTHVVHLRDGTIRPMTEQEIEWMSWPPEDGLEILGDLNTAESGEPVCERCGQFHPDCAPADVRTMYCTGPQPQPWVCPLCLEEWNDYWDDMWANVPHY